MMLRELVATLVKEFDIDTTACICPQCTSLRPQVRAVKGYLKTRIVSEDLMRAIIRPDLKQALIEEICLHKLNT